MELCLGQALQDMGVDLCPSGYYISLNPSAVLLKDRRLKRQKMN